MKEFRTIPFFGRQRQRKGKEGAINLFLIFSFKLFISAPTQTGYGTRLDLKSDSHAYIGDY